ncbi:28682_t:CDS:1, partial [Gigaspora margarita]
ITMAQKMKKPIKDNPYSLDILTLPCKMVTLCPCSKDRLRTFGCKKCEDNKCKHCKQKAFLTINKEGIISCSCIECSKTTKWKIEDLENEVIICNQDSNGKMYLKVYKHKPIVEQFIKALQ